MSRFDQGIPCCDVYPFYFALVGAIMYSSDFFCPADHVPDWQPCILPGMIEARSVNMKKTRCSL